MLPESSFVSNTMLHAEANQLLLFVKCPRAFHIDHNVLLVALTVVNLINKSTWHECVNLNPAGCMGTQPAEFKWDMSHLKSADCIPMQPVGSRLAHLHYVALLVKSTTRPFFSSVFFSGSPLELEESAAAPFSAILKIEQVVLALSCASA